MNGIIIINKPLNCTSHDIVAKIKKISKSKVGHTGTLDPLATGVLPILIGKGTLCSKYLINHDKTYIATVQLGIKTTTADSEGEVIERKNINKKILDEEYIQKKLYTFLGKQEQVPPMYSAIKVNGKKLYEYARKNQEIKVEPRQIEIYEIRLLNYDTNTDEIEFEVKCSKGTYIRSLCEDIAQRLDTVGYMKKLNRVQVGEFNIKQAISVENLNETKIEENLIGIEQLFNNSEKIELNNKKLQLFLNGVQLTNFNIDGQYRIYSDKKFIGIGIIKNQLLKRDIVI